MVAHVKKRFPRHFVRSSSSQRLPQTVTKQLEKIYSQSMRSFKKRPYKMTSGVLLSLGVASGIYFLMRYYKNK